MDTMTVDRLEGPKFTDRYTEAIAQIEAKREEKPLPVAPEPEQPAQGLDLMATLQESVSEGISQRRRCGSRSGRRARAAAAEEEDGREEAAGQPDRGGEDGGPSAAQRLSPATRSTASGTSASQRLAQGWVRMSWLPMRRQTMCCTPCTFSGP